MIIWCLNSYLVQSSADWKWKYNVECTQTTFNVETLEAQQLVHCLRLPWQGTMYIRNHQRQMVLPQPIEWQKGKPNSTNGSRVVPHRSTRLAQWCLTSEFGWNQVGPPWYDRLIILVHHTMQPLSDNPHTYTHTHSCEKCKVVRVLPQPTLDTKINQHNVAQATPCWFRFKLGNSW